MKKTMSAMKNVLDSSNSRLHAVEEKMNLRHTAKEAIQNENETWRGKEELKKMNKASISCRTTSSSLIYM